MSDEKLAEIVYEAIMDLYKTTKKPINLYVLFSYCKVKNKLEFKQSRKALIYLFKNNYIKWAEDGYVIPK